MAACAAPALAAFTLPCVLLLHVPASRQWSAFWCVSQNSKASHTGGCQSKLSGCAAERAAKLTALAEEFSEFESALLGDMLDDQAGDLLEVRLYLAVSCILAS